MRKSPHPNPLPEGEGVRKRGQRRRNEFGTRLLRCCTQPASDAPTVTTGLAAIDRRSLIPGRPPCAPGKQGLPKANAVCLVAQSSMKFPGTRSQSECRVQFTRFSAVSTRGIRAMETGKTPAPACGSPRPLHVTPPRARREARPVLRAVARGQGVTTSGNLRTGIISRNFEIPAILFIGHIVAV
jgi:hypothetical protein